MAKPSRDVPPPRASRAWRWLLAHGEVAVATAAALGFLGTLGNQPVLDDGWAALDNPLVWSLRNAGRIFRELYGFAGDATVRGPYRPITTLSYALDYAAHGRWTPGFHIVNVALHVVASLLVLGLARRLARAWDPERADLAAMAAALLFAVHPAHVEAVATIFGRTEPLSACFALGALLLALRRDAGWWRLPVAVLLLACGVLSKEVAVVTPALFVLVAIALPRAAGLEASPGLATPERRRALARAAAVALALSASVIPYLVGRGPSLAAAPVARWFPPGTPTPHVAMTMSRVLGEYLRILVFPAFLGGDFAYAARIPTFTAPTPGLVLATLAWAGAALFAVALLVRRRAPLVAVGLLWTFVALLPVLQIVPVGVLLAERLLYLPSVGFCLAAGALLSGLAPRAAGSPGRPRTASSSPGRPWLVLALAALLAARTVARTLDWRTRLAYWESELEKAPGEVVVNNNLAVEYQARGEYARAADRLRVALAAHPRYWRAWVNLGLARERLGDAAGARAALQRAVELAPDQPSPHVHLAFQLADSGEVAAGLGALEAARRLAPEVGEYARWQGELLLRLDRRSEARQALEDAVRLDPADREARRQLDGLSR